MKVEEKLNKLPFFINKRITQKCECCGKSEITKILNYELRIKILPHCDGHRYLIYYKSNNYGISFDSKYIGEHSGSGFKTIEEAIENFKNTYLHQMM